MVEKIFLTKSGKANLTCPECGKVKLVDVSKYVTAAKEVRFKCRCACSALFPVILERRQYVRKSCNMPGELIFGNKRYPVTVMDISRYGLKVKAHRALKLNPQDRIGIEFTLDNESRSIISREVLVCTINGLNIGVEFVSGDHYDKLGGYFLFHSG